MEVSLSNSSRKHYNLFKKRKQKGGKSITTMAMAATDLKDMLSIEIKSRPDSYSDQYNRLFMLKLLLVCSLIMGISWFTDSINCIVPGVCFILQVWNQRIHVAICVK